LSKFDLSGAQQVKAPTKKHRVCCDDFIAHQLLGNGSFGEVFLIERKSDKKLLAMKVLTKKKVRE
jgi:serine/threonine protein kinase